MNSKSKWILIVVLLAALFIALSYPGMIVRVIDAETREPIEGAVIMAEWTETKGVPGLTHTESYKVIEVVTGKKGWVWIPGIYNPFVHLGSLAIYKKNYTGWSKDDIFPGNKKRTDFIWCCFYKVFQLERFKPEYSPNEHISFMRSAISSGFSSKPLIKKALEAEAKKALKERKKTWNK